MALSGVKATLNRVAEKLELSMHVARELDSKILTPEATGRRADMAAMAKEKVCDNRMMRFLL